MEGGWMYTNCSIHLTLSCRPNKRVQLAAIFALAASVATIVASISVLDSTHTALSLHCLYGDPVGAAENVPYDQSTMISYTIRSNSKRNI